MRLGKVDGRPKIRVPGSRVFRCMSPQAQQLSVVDAPPRLIGDLSRELNPFARRVVHSGGREYPHQCTVVPREERLHVGRAPRLNDCCHGLDMRLQSSGVGLAGGHRGDRTCGGLPAGCNHDPFIKAIPVAPIGDLNKELDRAVVLAGFRAYQRIYISPIAKSERAMGEAQLFAPAFHLREGGLCAGQISLNEPGERDKRVHPPDWVIGREPGSFDFG